MKRRDFFKLCAKSCAFVGVSSLIVDRDISSAAHYTGPVCRLCRREGMKLFLRGDRCYTEKCAIERRSYAPGDNNPKNNLQMYAEIFVNVIDANTKKFLVGSNVYIFTSIPQKGISCGDCHEQNTETLSDYPNKMWNGQFEHLDEDTTPFSTDINGSINTVIECDTKIFIVVSHPAYTNELIGSLLIKEPITYTYDISLNPIPI